MKKQSLFESNKQFEPFSKKDYLERKEKFLRIVKQVESLLASAKRTPGLLG